MLLIVLHSPILTAKPLASYGRVYNVQDFIDASGGNDQLGLLRCLTTVKERLWDHPENHTIIIPSRLTQAYTIQEQLTCMGTSPGQTNGMLPRNNAGSSVWITIMGLDLTDDELEEQFPDLTNTMLPNTTYTSNTDYLGGSYTLHGQVCTQAMTDFLNQHISSTNMHCNLNPASEHFLSFSVSPRMPRLESVSTVNHNFFYFKNDVVASAPHATGINIMGLHLKGINNATNTCIYDANSPQQNNLFQYGIGIHLERLKFVALDQLFIEDMYGTGILVNNKEVAGTNDSVTVRDNILHNIWALKYMPVTQGNNTTYDDGGDGITFQGIWQGVTERNWVLNNTGYTGQFGRIGIAAPAEFNRDVTIRHNQVSGYDRGVHVENNGGGFTIAANRLTGSETAIVFDSFQDGCPAIRSSQVVANYMSNEGIPTNQSGLIKLYPPHLFFTSGAFTTNLHNKTLVEKNYALMTAGGITAYATPNGIVFPYGNFSAGTGRWHVLSAIRRMQLDCNIFRTEGMAPGFSNGGMSLLASIPGLGPCSVAAEDVGLPHFPFRVENNLFQDLNTLSINPYTIGLHVLGANVVGYLNQGNTPQPSVAVYSNGLTPGIPNCAQTWDNTLCNGKPLVAEHDYLWDNTTLGTTGSHTGETILVGGTLTIAANLSFENCIFLMAPGAQIQISNGFTLTLDHCVLQAACDELWDGIIADDPSEQMIIMASTLRDMNNGVQALYGARIAATGTTFTDNMTAMQIRHAPPGYVSGNGGNQGIVEGNTFTSTGAGPLYALPSVTQGQYGLKLIGCAEVRIGCPPAAGPSNLFSRLSTGIFIQPDAQYPTALYDLRYNRFADIRQNPNSPPDIPAILQNTYGTPAGAGIYIRRMQDPVVPVNWQNSTTPMVNILGQNGVSAFARCDKAVVGTGVSVDLWHYRINDCVGGLLVNDAHYQHFMVFGNQMDEVMLGVQLAGNLHKAQVQSNQIRLKPLNTPNYTLNGIPDPKGIEVQYWTSVHPGQTSISNNTVEIPGIRGAGITLSKNGKMSRVSDNTINFTTNITTQFNPNLASDPQLHGIVSQLGDGNYLSCNFVNGHPDVAMLGLRNSSALLLSRTLNHEVHCNQVNNTRFGAQIRGYCKTDSLLFRANTFTNHVHGLLTVPAVFSDEGDMGQIGDANQDNNNAFNGIYAQNEATYRYWGNAQNILQRKIYTAQTFSNGSNYPQDPFAPFNIQPTSSNTQNCYGISGCGSTWEPVAPPDLDPTWALEVAADSMYYYLFPELSQWVAQYQLYSNLERDSALLAANTLLNTFYQTRQNQAMGMLRGVEKMVGILSDSTSRNDSLLFMTRLNDAINQNNMVSGPEDHVQHEKWINAMLFKVFQYGRDSITLQEQEEISALAHSCPAVNGLAVYYARFLNTYYEPLSGYEDYALCNGNAKGAGGPFDALNSFLQDPKGQAEESSEPNDLLKQITVYPVPASDLVTFRSTEALGDAATLQIFDLSGRNLIATPWPKGSAEVSMHVAALPSGLYTWTCKGSGGVFAGKLIIGK